MKVELIPNKKEVLEILKKYLEDTSSILIDNIESNKYKVKVENINSNYKSIYILEFEVKREIKFEKEVLELDIKDLLNIRLEKIGNLFQAYVNNNKVFEFRTDRWFIVESYPLNYKEGGEYAKYLLHRFYLIYNVYFFKSIEKSISYLVNLDEMWDFIEKVLDELFYPLFYFISYLKSL